jgi:hypothetical protein
MSSKLQKRLLTSKGSGEVSSLPRHEALSNGIPCTEEQGAKRKGLYPSLSREANQVANMILIHEMNKNSVNLFHFQGKHFLIDIERMVPSSCSYTCSTWSI